MTIGYFDAHCDTIQLVSPAGPGQKGRPGEGLWDFSGHVSLEKLKNFTPRAQFFAFFQGAEESGDHPERARFFDELLAVFRAEIESNREKIAFVRSAAELEAAWAAGKLGAF